MHTIRRLRELGQSVWLDFLDHALITSGELQRMIDEDGLSGETSNPTIFQKAIAGSSDYDGYIRGAPASESDGSIFEAIQVRDVTLACDRFRPLYDRTRGEDGFVSIEVSASLARNTSGSIDEARRLWSRVGRPNLMVKIPGTREGIPAIEQCLTEGININITLLFAVERYVEVANAYLRALEARAAKNEPIDRVASVASFFVSRVDTKVDKALDALEGDKRECGRAERGKAAIANAKVAFERYEALFAGSRWEKLASLGARPQHVLWASTSTKDPAYPELYYPEALIGPGTIDTMPKETLRAYLDHGKPEARLTTGRDQAHAHLASLATLGLEFDRMTAELEEEGIRAFAASYEQALKSIAEKRRIGSPVHASPG